MLDLSSVRRAVASTELVKQKTSDSGGVGAGKDGSGSEESPDPENPPRSPTEVAAMQHHHHQAAASSTLLLQKAMFEAMMSKTASEK